MSAAWIVLETVKESLTLSDPLMVVVVAVCADALMAAKAKMKKIHDFIQDGIKNETGAERTAQCTTFRYINYT